MVPWLGRGALKKVIRKVDYKKFQSYFRHQCKPKQWILSLAKHLWGRIGKEWEEEHANERLSRRTHEKQ